MGSGWVVRNRPNKPANDSHSGFLASPFLIPPQDQPNGHDDDRDGRADQSPDSQPLDDAPGHRRDELQLFNQRYEAVDLFHRTSVIGRNAGVVTLIASGFETCSW